MKSWNALPAVTLSSSGTITTDFLARQIFDFRSAGHYLYQLPYGRNADRADCRLVLTEGRGTCSTKHALLAALACEQQLSVVLTLGMYEMHERNTPGVGEVLDGYNLFAIPEAHCYLTYAGSRIDITRSGASPAEPITRFLYEEEILPTQIGEYKINVHKQFLQHWLTENSAVRYTFPELWKIREECIAALAQ